MWKHRIGTVVCHEHHPEYRGVVIEQKTCMEVNGDGDQSPWYEVVWVVSHVDNSWSGNESEGSIQEVLPPWKEQ